jgi:peroxiredoxin
MPILPILLTIMSLFTSQFTSDAMIATVGQKAPAFSLKNLEGKQVNLSDFAGKVVVLEWMNEGCPFVKGHYELGDVQKLQKEYEAKGVVWLTINSTRPDHPEAFNASMSKEQLTAWHSAATDNLMDEDRTVGHLYNAKTTPHMFVIDGSGVLRYSGAMDDDARGKGKNATVNYVKSALDEIIAGKAVTISSTTPYGCSVKY